jgi:hypothetical protein
MSQQLVKVLITTLGRIYTDDEFTYTSSATTSLDYNILEQQDV